MCCLTRPSVHPTRPSTRPSCSIAVSTCGLANIDVPPRRPSRVRHRFDFAVSSPPFMLPVSSAAPVAVSSSPVQPSSVESSSAVASSSPVCSVPVTTVLPSRFMSSIQPRGRPAPVWSRPVLPSRPIRYVAPPPRLSPCTSLLPVVFLWFVCLWLPFLYCLLLRLVSSCRFCCVSLGHCCCFGLGLFCCILVANLFL